MSSHLRSHWALAVICFRSARSTELLFDQNVLLENNRRIALIHLFSKNWQEPQSLRLIKPIYIFYLGYSNPKPVQQSPRIIISPNPRKERALATYTSILVLATAWLMNVSTSRDFIMHHVFANASLDVALCSAASFSDYSAHVCTGEESATFLGYFHTQETPCRHGFMIHLCCTCLWSRCPPRCCDFGAD
jgi:hypothetical protein